MPSFMAGHLENMSSPGGTWLGDSGAELTSLAPGQLQVRNRPASHLQPGLSGAMSSRDREDPGDSAGRARRGSVFLAALFQGSICVIWCPRRAPDSNYPHSLSHVKCHHELVRGTDQPGVKSAPPFTTFPCLATLFKLFQPHL